ncbi:hypothetical protein EYZ11_001944 [Aspergillus tanneri]|uniref:Uncharacterized protein n=1 Tax=Aspergillus tanneri TaxID=1220188 RepID=A0A4S3JS58_9EURO|nr:hypothetical protein EYZ11_001944 [Aspergillus tanneri]
MQKRPAKKQKSASKKKSLKPSDPDNPEAEHVEVLDNQPKPQAESSPSKNVQSRTSKSPNKPKPKHTRILTNAGASLQQHTKKNRGSHPQSLRNVPVSPSSSRLPTLSPQAEAAIQLETYSPKDTCKGDARMGQLPATAHAGGKSYLKIFFGRKSPYPRWLVERKSSSAAFQDSDPEGLEWVLDAEPHVPPLTSGSSWLYSYAYWHLENALTDPIFRHYVRRSIREDYEGAYSRLQDPIPPLPPALYSPCFLDRPAALDRIPFRFPGYEHPSLAQRLGT